MCPAATSTAQGMNERQEQRQNGGSSPSSLFAGTDVTMALILYFSTGVSLRAVLSGCVLLGFIPEQGRTATNPAYSLLLLSLVREQAVEDAPQKIFKQLWHKTTGGYVSLPQKN